MSYPKKICLYFNSGEIIVLTIEDEEQFDKIEGLFFLKKRMNFLDAVLIDFSKVYLIKQL